jgi:Acetyltransferase (GNAT) domain
MKITNANASNIDMLIDEINNEFIVERKKKLHIRNRFPKLFNSSNFNNIHILNETKNGFCSVIVVKTVDIVIEDKQRIKAFFVGAQMTPKQHQGKGYGKDLFKYITEKYLNNNFSVGVGWTRLQSFYQSLGWETYENGTLLELIGLKIDKKTKNIYQCNDPNTYNILDSIRVKLLSNYIIRKNANNTINGFGTIYTPAENSYCIYCKCGKEISAYAYGAFNSEAVYIYELIYADKIDFENILSSIFCYHQNKRVFINVYQNDLLLKKLPIYFEKVIVTNPVLSIYAYRDHSIFTQLKNLYIPFSDRI